jgi:hypothetical protein
LRILRHSDQKVLEQLAGDLQFESLPPSVKQPAGLPQDVVGTAGSAPGAAETHSNWPAELIDVPQ